MEPLPSTITLQPFELFDADDFPAWVGDDIVTCYLHWDSIASLEAAELYLWAIAIRHHLWHHSICIGDHSIEYVSIKPGSDDERCHTHDGYAVGAEFWGRGFAMATLRMAARSVFDKMPELVRLEAFVEVENRGSQRVLEKLSVAIPRPWCHSIFIDDRSIGYVSIKPEFGDEQCRASVGYAVRAKFWGRGFAMAALRMAARHVFDKMPELVRLEATLFYLDRMS